MHRVDTRVDSKHGGNASSEKVDDVEGVQPELDLKTTHNALPAPIRTDQCTGSGIEVIGLGHGVLQDIESNHENRGECVRELENHGSADKGREVRDLRDSSADDKGKRPINWNKGHPDPFSLFGLKGRPSEDSSAKVGV